ncbi:hypothetical protein MKW98_004208 [Papaver atlanticum]|uniref:Uncharacterized protein n=1 Tax=Papaver atlanticum TaxID=357466 RepID=A0AAD4XSA3_9MAGN|nr:hypothetical protein MKW98_004208 [Papaver atlanticum]
MIQVSNPTLVAYGVSNRYNMSALQPLVQRRGSIKIRDDSVCNHVVAEATMIAVTYQSYNIDKVVVSEQDEVRTTEYCWSIGLETFILNVIRLLGRDVTARSTIINDLQTAIESIDSSKGASVEPFGSFVSNVYTRWGDLNYIY